MSTAEQPRGPICCCWPHSCLGERKVCTWTNTRQQGTSAEQLPTHLPTIAGHMANSVRCLTRVSKFLEVAHGVLASRQGHAAVLGHLQHVLHGTSPSSVTSIALGCQGTWPCPALGQRLPAMCRSTCQHASHSLGCSRKEFENWQQQPPCIRSRSCCLNQTAWNSTWAHAAQSALGGRHWPSLSAGEALHQRCMCSHSHGQHVLQPQGCSMKARPLKQRESLAYKAYPHILPGCVHRKAWGGWGHLKLAGCYPLSVPCASSSMQFARIGNGIG